MFLIVLFLIGLLVMFALEDAQKKKRSFSEKTQPFSDLRRIVDEHVPSLSHAKRRL